jgi:hypothetical protein
MDHKIVGLDDQENSGIEHQSKVEREMEMELNCLAIAE